MNCVGQKMAVLVTAVPQIRWCNSGTFDSKQTAFSNWDVIRT